MTNIYKYICINYSRHVRKWHLCFEGIFEDIFGWRPDGLHILKWKAMNFYFYGVYSDHLEFTWETLLSERPSIHPVSFILRKLLGTIHAWTTFNLPTRAQESVLHCSSLCIESDESMLERMSESFTEDQLWLPTVQTVTREEDKWELHSKAIIFEIHKR